MEVKDRLILYLKKKGVTQTEFSRQIGVSKAFVTSMRRSISPEKLKEIKRSYPDLNTTWLLTGEGDMLMVGTAPVAESGYTRVPLLTADSLDSFLSDKANANQYVMRHLTFPRAKDGDVAILQTGDSMSPLIPPGAILHIRKINDWKEFLSYGSVYVIRLYNGQHITKKIRQHSGDPQNYVWCESFNPDVDDNELPKELISEVWKVNNVLINYGW